jgi:hypothetical protein
VPRGKQRRCEREESDADCLRNATALLASPPTCTEALVHREDVSPRCPLPISWCGHTRLLPYATLSVLHPP